MSKENLLNKQSGKVPEDKDREKDMKMHYRNTSNENKPTYLFGENPQHAKKNDDIFLNRSGWIQMNQSQKSESRKESMNKLLAANSKIEELISRNEARRVGAQMMSGKDDNVTILKIDSQYHQIGSDRPGYLPVKTNIPRDPPPPTPILSPPPAFQDHKNRRITEIKNGARIHLSVTDSDNNASSPTIGKGMVFSRSFEYDNRKSSEFSNEIFSKSFDFDLEMKKNPNRNFLSRYGKSTTFASLTGISPNYLTKKENPREASPSKAGNQQTTNSIFPKVIPGKNVNTGSFYRSTVASGASKNKSVDENRSRRSQFMRPTRPGYRSFETSMGQRLNSCDSGARSGKLFVNRF